MERYLELNILNSAISGNTNLPTAEELSSKIAQAELDLLISGNIVDDGLIEVAWYLFTISSLSYSNEKFGVERVRSSYQVCGHILDLYLASAPDITVEKKYSYIFAAQVSYLRSKLSPNAIAIFKKNVSQFEQLTPDLDNLEILAMKVAVATIGFNIAYVYQSTKSIQHDVTRIVREWQLSSIFDTPFGSSFGVLLGCRNLISFLVYGDENAFVRAKEYFYNSVNCKPSYEDKYTRWLSSLFLRLCDELYSSSAWKVLPANVPAEVKKAFTLGSPRVLTLWPPQIDYLSNYNPFDDNSKFQFISTPTSGGKTLISQLIIAHHLSTRRTSACYVAPTRSLCREVEQSLKNRFSYLNLKASLSEELIAWGFNEDDLLEPEIQILTPESILYQLRENTNAFLEKYKLFIFDEVHSLGDKGRGWVLEEVIALMKTLSIEKEIRIIFISAVIGNRNHFINWLGSNGENVLSTHSEWRATRRIHALWSTNVKWSDVSREEQMVVRSRSIYNRRIYYPVHGQLTVRTSSSGNIKTLETVQSIGEFAHKIPINPSLPRAMDETKSIRKNDAIKPLVELLTKRGPILCLESTRAGAVLLAKDLAELREINNNQKLIELAAFIESKLSAEHPLSRVVRKGVAYHHGSLPGDIRIELENAVRDGIIEILVATTTMTEGVNLPVQAVLISSLGTYGEDQSFIEIIKGSKMANAIGRAGRATQETEGCVVLFHRGPVSQRTFESLDPDDSSKHVSSNLLFESFLQEIEEYEHLKNNGHDAIIEFSSGVLSDFFSFMWFYLYYKEQTTGSVFQDLKVFLKNTMFWIQSDDNKKAMVEHLALDLFNRFTHSSEEEKKIYGSSTAKLDSTRKLRNIFNTINSLVSPDDTDLDLIEKLLDSAILNQLLAVKEAPTKKFYTQRTGNNRNEIIIDHLSFIQDWISGLELPILAERYFYQVVNIDYKFEQLGDYIAIYLENFFPWAMRILLNWINNSREDLNIPNYLPGLIAKGVPNRAALAALNMGIYSRSLAIKLASWKIQNHNEVNDSQLGILLKGFLLNDLVSILNLSTNEWDNIVHFFKAENGKVLNQLNRSGSCEIDLWLISTIQIGVCNIEAIQEFSNLKVIQSGQMVANVPTIYHFEIESLIRGGVPITYEILSSGKLKIKMDKF